MTYSWETAHHHHTLGRRFVHKAKPLWNHFAIADSLGRSLTYGKLLVGAILLGKKLKRLTDYQENVGLILPTSVGGVVANIALTMIGKTIVNLNYTAGRKRR